MALIRQTLAATLARDAVVLDLGDLARQGDAIKARARIEAGRILDEARAERERLVSGAAADGRQAGFAKGQEEGREQGEAAGRQAALREMQERLAKVESGWASSLREFDADRGRMLLEARQDVLRLAVLIGEMVTKRAIAIEPDRVVDQLAAVLAVLAKPTRLVIAVHPEDQPLIREALPGLAERYGAATHVEMAADPSVARGSCVARTAGAGGGGGAIDASIATQLERIVEVLMPGAAP